MGCSLWPSVDEFFCLSIFYGLWFVVCGWALVMSNLLVGRRWCLQFMVYGYECHFWGLSSSSGLLSMSFRVGWLLLTIIGYWWFANDGGGGANKICWRWWYWWEVMLVAVRWNGIGLVSVDWGKVGWDNECS